MVANWMRPKLIKMGRERRAWSRPYTIRGSSPNWSNGVQYRDTSLDLVEETTVTNERATRKQRIPELSELSEVRRELDDPLFITPLSNPTQRLRIFYNSQRTCFIAQWVLWKEQEVRISFSYPTFTMIYEHWMEDKIRWRPSKSFIR